MKEAPKVVIVPLMPVGWPIMRIQNEPIKKQLDVRA